MFEIFLRILDKLVMFIAGIKASDFEKKESEKKKADEEGQKFWDKRSL